MGVVADRTILAACTKGTVQESLRSIRFSKIPYRSNIIAYIKSGACVIT